jgi:hypothetical protein
VGARGRRDPSAAPGGAAATRAPGARPGPLRSASGTPAWARQGGHLSRRPPRSRLLSECVWTWNGSTFFFFRFYCRAGGTHPPQKTAKYDPY